MTSAVTTGPGDHVAPGGPFDLVVRAARAVLPEGERAVEVGVSGGSVAAVVPLGTGLAGAEVIELADDEVLLPGLVDSHVHVNEPGRTEWEGFASATRAAAAGGVTTIVDMPLNSLPPTTTVEHLDVKRERAAGQAFVDVGFWGGAVPGNTADLRPLHDEGVFGFKCFLADSGVPEFGHLEAAELRADLAELTTFDGLMIVHAEDPDTLSGAPHAPGRRYSDFLASRPAKAEQAAIAEVVEAARATGARAHVLHLSDADSLPLIAAARADGVRLTVETCPHYLSLDADHVPDGATAYKCCPPIRESDNQDRLWQGLLDGVIDIVVTDHSPATADLKEPADGDFAAAWGGVASLQLGLAVVWTEARRRGVPLGRVVRWMSSGPAGLVGLERKGGIAVGKDADLVVFAPEATFVVEPGRLHHKNPVTPYAGRDLTGVVRRTLLRGAEVTDEPAGTLLRRQEIRGQARFPENENEDEKDEDTMTRLQPGDHAPDFTLPDTDGTPVSLASVRTGADKGVVVYFYPKAGTPGCTTEACDFRDNLASLAAAGYAVVGVSADPVEEIRAFAEAEHLTFPLLSDADHAVADAYGAWGPKTFDGRTFDGVHRCTFVVGTDGAVQRAEYDVEATGHVAALRRALVDA